MPSDSDLDQMTTPAAKLVILQRIKQKLGELDKDLDQRHPARDPPGHCQGWRGLIKGSPAQDQQQK